MPLHPALGVLGGLLGLAFLVSARLPAIRARREHCRSCHNQTARPLMSLGRRRFMAAIAGGLLAAPLVAETQDCASPTFKKGKFAIPLDRDVVRAEWVSRGYTD